MVAARVSADCLTPSLIACDDCFSAATRLAVYSGSLLRSASRFLRYSLSSSGDRLGGFGLRRKASLAWYSGEAMVARSLASLAAFLSGSFKAADILACT